MPQSGPYRRSLIFLEHRQASYFRTRRPIGQPFVDKLGARRDIVSGRITPEEEHYGIFEDDDLVATLALAGPASDGDCPTPFWSVGLIEVTNPFQRRGLGSGLFDGVFASRGQALASDLDQDAGGADLWRRWIGKHPGKIELHGPEGLIDIVSKSVGGFTPDPWLVRESRLVRQP